jgi:hypothetical protein
MSFSVYQRSNKKHIISIDAKIIKFNMSFKNLHKLKIEGNFINLIEDKIPIFDSNNSTRSSKYWGKVTLSYVKDDMIIYIKKRF